MAIFWTRLWSTLSPLLPFNLQNLKIDLAKHYRSIRLPYDDLGRPVTPLDWTDFNKKRRQVYIALNLDTKFCELKSHYSLYNLRYLIETLAEIRSLKFAFSDIRQMSSINQMVNRHQCFIPWFEYLFPRHTEALESLDFELVDHNERDVVERVLFDFFKRNNKLKNLSITAFLRRSFAETLMAAVGANELPLKTLYIKAYSFESDPDFISKTILKRKWLGVINQLEKYEVISYARSDKYFNWPPRGHPRSFPVIQLQPLPMQPQVALQFQPQLDQPL